MQGSHLFLHDIRSKSSKPGPRCSSALLFTGWERLQAFRGLHNSVRSGRTLTVLRPSTHSLQFLGTQYQLEF
jgi:hypothetical protein